MTRPAVSVVLATYNYGRFLPAAVASVRAQTYRNIEILIIDDGSTDATSSVVRPFLGDPRVLYHRQEHAGQARAKNVGIALASAPLVAFLDADDIWLPRKLERQVALFRGDPGLGVVYARRRLIDEDGWELEYRQPPLYRGLVLPQMYLCNFVCFSSSVVMRTAFERAGHFDEGLELAVDYDLWLRVARHFRFDFVDEPLVLYRTGHVSLSRRQAERAEAVGFIMRRFLETGGRELLDPAHIRLVEADYHCDRAAVHGGGRSLVGYARALAHRPLHLPAWRGLASGWWPEAVRGTVRRALGRPDWRTRRVIPSPPPPTPDSPLPTSPEPSRRPSLATSVAANWIGFGVQLVAAFLLSPLLVRGLGDARYGIWALIDSVLAYFTLFDLGVAASVVRYVARFEAVRDDASLNRVFSTSVALFAAAGMAVAGLASAVAWGGLGVLGVPDAILPEARPALLLLGLNLALGLPLSVFPAVLDGLGRYPAKSGIRTAGLVVRCLVVYLLLRRGGGLVALATVSLLFSVVEHLAMAIAVRCYLPRLRCSPTFVDRATFRTIRGYSGDALLAMVAGRLSFQTDALVIGAFLAPPFIAFFAVAGRLVEYAKDSLRVATAVLTPAVSALDAQGDRAAIRAVLLTSTRYALWLVLPMQLGLLLLGRPFLALWLGEEYAARSYPVLAILAAPLALAVSQSVSARVLYGSGRLRWFARLALAEALANLAISVALVGPYGIAGVAFGTALPSVVAGVAVAAYVCRHVEVGVGTYLRRVFLAPCLAAAFLAAAWASLASSVALTSWTALAAVGGVGIGSYFVAALAVEGRQRGSRRVLGSDRA